MRCVALTHEQKWKKIILFVVFMNKTQIILLCALAVAGAAGKKAADPASSLRRLLVQKKRSLGDIASSTPERRAPNRSFIKPLENSDNACSKKKLISETYVGKPKSPRPSIAMFCDLIMIDMSDGPLEDYAVIDATKIIEDYRRFFASFWPGIFRISAKNLPLLSLRPSLTVGMTKIPKIPGLFHFFLCWNLRNLPAESTSEMLVSFTGRRGGGPPLPPAVFWGEEVLSSTMS